MDWRFSTFLLFLFVLFFGITWATSQDGLCHSKFVADVLAQGNKDGALNCFEFWLNRYQTLIGSIIALTAALVALLPARGQLREMMRQTSGVARTAAIDHAETVGSALAIVRGMTDIPVRIWTLMIKYEQEKPINIYIQWPDRWEGVRAELKNHIAQLEPFVSRSGFKNTDARQISVLRAEGIRTLVQMEALGNYFRRETTGPYYDEGEVDATPEEGKRLIAAVWQAYNSLHPAIDETASLLYERREQAWAAVRLLEDRLSGQT